ncbi:MAG: 2-oxoglutarate ferredoxin oxidoreductase subunit gamma [Bacillota bacterium]|jgi:2-oxoglutarate ferredoxin oxidoreductase subunit gamma|nr:2-oxoglutarate ferredoxin oxidoreductase subunit gamma [Bacillota bacterium]
MRDVEKCEIRISGSGGQGVVLASIIFAEALVAEGYHVIQTQVYGPEARGGASRGEVLYGKERPNYLSVRQPDILVAMTQQACDRYLPSLKPEGTLILDSFFVEKLPERQTGRTYAVPLTKMAIDEFGKPLYANIVMLGFMNGVTEQVALEHLEEAVVKRVAPAFAEENRRALRLGYEKARSMLNK